MDGGHEAPPAAQRPHRARGAPVRGRRERRSRRRTAGRTWAARRERRRGAAGRARARRRARAAADHRPRSSGRRGAARRAWPPNTAKVRTRLRAPHREPQRLLPGEVPGMLRAIYAFHRYGRGWNDIGYNFVVDRFGRIFEARAGGMDEAVIGAHAGGYNDCSTGIAVLGEYGAQRSPRPPAPRSSSCCLEALAARRPRRGPRDRAVDPAGAIYSRFPARGASRCRGWRATATPTPPTVPATPSTASCPRSAGRASVSPGRRPGDPPTSARELRARSWRWPALLSGGPVWRAGRGQPAAAKRAEGAEAQRSPTPKASGRSRRAAPAPARWLRALFAGAAADGAASP